MYKRTKGQCKKKISTYSANGDAVERVLELMQSNAVPISLVSSPRTRIAELKSIFTAEYPLLDFKACEAAVTG